MYEIRIYDASEVGNPPVIKMRVDANNQSDLQFLINVITFGLPSSHRIVVSQPTGIITARYIMSQWGKFDPH